MVLKCYVKLLDGTQAEFEVEKGAKASKLFNNVCDYLSILEKDYFGLACKRSDLQHCWLKLEKKIRTQVNKSDELKFEFAVRFYPSDPILLREEITRYQICLQIRKDLKNNLECSIDKLANLICFWLKSDNQGIDVTSQAVTGCLEEIGKNGSEESSTEFVDRVLALSQHFSHKSSAEADEQFLMTAASLRLYGVHFYKGKESSGNDILIGISSKGVTEKRKDQLPVLHKWSRIKNIQHSNSKFKIKLFEAPVNGDPRVKKSFIFDSKEQVLLIWKTAVDHHVFFRVDAKDSEKRPKRKGSILRRLSSKKKKPKTEADAQEDSKSIKREPPNVTRVNSIRMSTTSEPTIPKESSTENRPDSEMPESGKALETVPESTEAQSTLPQSSEDLTMDSNIPGASAMPNDENDDYATIGEKLPLDPQEDEREYTDDDIVDVIHSKPEGSASGGSATFLFKEIIVEEDEDDHVYAVPSPRKAIPTNYGQLLSEYEEVVEPLDEISGDEIMQPSVERDPPEFTEDFNQYNEEWGDIPVSIAPTAKKDVRFETDDMICDDDEESRVEMSPSFAFNDENGPIPAQTLHRMPVTEDIVPLDSAMQFSLIDSLPTLEDQSLLDDEEFLTIKEYVPKARKDSTEESDLIEESDVEQCFDSPDAGAAFHVETEFSPTDLVRKSPSTDIVRSDDCDERNPSDIEKPTSADDMDQQKDLVPSSNDSTNAKSSHTSPVVSGKKEPVYHKSARSLGMDFRVGDAYKPMNTAVKGLEKVTDCAASTTAATIGDEDDFSIHELDEDIMYRHDYSNSEENEEDDAKASDHSDDDSDRSESHEELLRQSIPLDTGKETLKGIDLLGSKSSERNHDGAASTTAATVGDEDTLSLEEFEDDVLNEGVTEEAAGLSNETVSNQDVVEPEATINKTDSDSKYSSLSNVTDDTDELLDIDALEKAWSQGAQLDEDDELFRVLFRSPPKRKPRNKSEINLTDVKRGRQQAMAFRSTIDEEPISPRRRENLARRPFIPSWPFDPMAILTSDELNDLDRDALEAAIAAQMYLLDGEKRLEEMDMMEEDTTAVDDEDIISSEVIANAGKHNLGLTEKVKIRSRSPSASPRMVGEEFIPGVPDFIHSVIPYRLPTPTGDANGPPSQEMDESKNPCFQESTFLEDTHDCEKSIDDNLTITHDVEKMCDEKSDHEVDISVLSDAGLPIASSGRSTPSGSNSLSEGTSSSNSKSSGSSFPRFVHSVFPLRRASDQRRGRSKTRRKREKKITKQKNKKVARSKSRDKKTAKNAPSIEVSSAPQVESFIAFPMLTSPSISTTLSQSLTHEGEDKHAGVSNTPKRLEDQESLDKITLSDSDDAHSKLQPARTASGNVDIRCVANVILF